MSYRYLDWDSRFFGLRAAQITVDDALDGVRLAECLERNDADVIYVFLPITAAKPCRTVLEAFAGTCYDRKVTLGKQVDPLFAAWDQAIAEATVESEALRQLAYASGHLSRFFRDPRFEPHFKKLYAEWLRKSFTDANHKVFAAADPLRMQGMVTVSAAGGIGKIGLMAIDGKCRRQGLGMRLLKQCEAYYVSLNVRTCKVVTQKNNIAACKLYQKAGYMIENEQDIWHVWKN